MIKKNNMDNLTKTLKAAGFVGLNEISNVGTSAILGTAKTIKESTWEKKVLLGGLLGNLAAGVLDMDLPFANLGIESMAGIDALVDNASDIAMGVAGASMAYKLANNIQELNNSNKSTEDLLKELGLDFEEDEEVSQKEFNIKPDLNLTEEQELMMLKQLIAKHGTKLQGMK